MRLSNFSVCRVWIKCGLFLWVFSLNPTALASVGGGSG